MQNISSILAIEGLGACLGQNTKKRRRFIYIPTYLSKDSYYIYLHKTWQNKIDWVPTPTVVPSKLGSYLN